jgi:hypothetical protein
MQRGVGNRHLSDHDGFPEKGQGVGNNIDSAGFEKRFGIVGSDGNIAHRNGGRREVDVQGADRDPAIDVFGRPSLDGGLDPSVEESKGQDNRGCRDQDLDGK